jgi:hypothetical protein
MLIDRTLTRTNLPTPELHLRSECTGACVAGVRPYRPGSYRLDAQTVSGRFIVHDYGHGGAGITLSWACAAKRRDILSSWNLELPLREWPIRQLSVDYPFLAYSRSSGRGMAARLVREGKILPVLDGLDEITPELRPAAIRAIDRAMADRDPVVVTCRTAEYDAAVTQTGSHLSRAMVVELKPVEAGNAIGFLGSTLIAGDERWQPVLEEMDAHPDGPLGKALSRPLTLFLARTV